MAVNTNSMFDNTVFTFTIICIRTAIVIILVVWAVNKSNKAKAASKNVVWPPKDYMQDIGSKCPDYWTYIGVDGSGNSICENKFNIPTSNNQCMDDKNTMTFNKIPKWPIKKGDRAGQVGTGKLIGKGGNINLPCDWIKSCGPTSNTPSASWLGMNDIC